MNSKIHRRLELLQSKARKNRIKGLRGGGGGSAEINITPLVDVVLVLLIIFMVVLKKIDAVVSLPQAFDPKTVGESDNPLSVFIRLDGVVIVDSNPVAEANLISVLEVEVRKNPFLKVHLSADRNLEFKEIRKMLNALRDAGVNVAELMSEPIKEMGN